MHICICIDIYIYILIFDVFMTRWVYLFYSCRHYRKTLCYSYLPCGEVRGGVLEGGCWRGGGGGGGVEREGCTP